MNTPLTHEQMIDALAARLRTAKTDGEKNDAIAEAASYHGRRNRLAHPARGDEVTIGKGYMVWTLVSWSNGKANLARTDHRGDKCRRLLVPAEKLKKVQA